MKDIKAEIHVDDTEIDMLIAKLKEANSLADELASKIKVNHDTKINVDNLATEIAEYYKSYFETMNSLNKS